MEASRALMEVLAAAAVRCLDIQVVIPCGVGVAVAQRAAATPERLSLEVQVAVMVQQVTLAPFPVVVAVVLRAALLAQAAAVRSSSLSSPAKE